MPEVTKHGFMESPRRAVPIERVQVAEWCPSPDGTGPAEQVHMLIWIEGDPVPLAMRMKTGPAVDALVDALVEHRTNVFGRR